MARIRRFPARLIPAVAAGAALVLTIGAAATAAPGGSVTAIPGQLAGVTVLSPSDAWAVGYQCVPDCSASSVIFRTLILHWDGTSWARVASPDPGTHESLLAAVTALSPSDAWAVGNYESASGGFRTLILHWNGTSWSHVPSPSPEVVDGSFLTGASAVSPSDVWAAGWYYGTGGENSNTLVLHWDGAHWAMAHSPSPSHLGFNSLGAVGARSASDAWAAGSDDTGTVLLRWNGTSWTRVPSPSPGAIGTDSLNGVATVSASDAWAVGGTAASTLALHWNGSRWSRAATPNPGRSSVLNAVSARSASVAWAAGCFSPSASTAPDTLVLRWNGTAWARLASPNPGGTAGTCLNGVSGLSASDVWAVGATDPVLPGRTVILHWNGTGWARF